MLRKGDDLWQGIPRGIVASNSPGLQRELVINGMGIAALADPFASLAVSKGWMQCVMPEWQLPKVTLWSVTSGRKFLPSKTKAWIRLLQDRLNDSTA